MAPGKAARMGGAGRAPAAARQRQLQDRAQARRPRELGSRARRHRDPVLKKIFLDYDQKALDDQYEQRVWVPHADEIIRRCSAASDAVRQRIGEPRTERYGSTPIETLDVYGQGGMAFVFVHGGAWRR